MTDAEPTPDAGLPDHPEAGDVVSSPAPARIEPGVRDRHDTPLRELVSFLPDVATLLWRVARDPRVSWSAKALAAGAVLYVASPLDLVPDGIPVVGQLDDVWLVARALRHLFNTAGYDLVRELWPGSDDGFALLLVVAGIER